jgi:hypothetical protein
MDEKDYKLCAIVENGASSWEVTINIISKIINAIRVRLEILPPSNIAIKYQTFDSSVQILQFRLQL